MDFIKNNLTIIVITILFIACYYFYNREGFGYTWFQVIDLDEKHKKHSMKCKRGCKGECNFYNNTCDCGTD
jgi:hypothetical protein